MPWVGMDLKDISKKFLSKKCLSPFLAPKVAQCMKNTKGLGATSTTPTSNEEFYKLALASGAPNYSLEEVMQSTPVEFNIAY